MTDGHHFNNILLGGRGGTNPGQFKVHSGGLAWKRQGGGKAIEIDKADVTSVTWMKVPRAYQLGVRIKDGLFYRFIGFREQDVSNLTNFIQKNMGVTPDEKQLSVSGHNWGGIDIDGNMLTFMVGSKQAFEVSLPDVAQTQMQGKTDVLLEFHVDDTTGANEKDSLMDVSFHVPTSNTQFVGDEARPPAHILWETILKFADVGSSEEPVVTLKELQFLHQEDVIVLSFISHFYDSKDKLMILKSNTAASFGSFFCQSQTILIHLLLSLLIHQSVKDKHCILTLLFSLRQRQ